MIKNKSNKITFLACLILGITTNLVALPVITNQQDNILSGFFGLFLLTTMWFGIGVCYQEISQLTKKEKQNSTGGK